MSEQSLGPSLIDMALMVADRPEDPELLTAYELALGDLLENAIPEKVDAYSAVISRLGVAAAAAGAALAHEKSTEVARLQKRHDRLTNELDRLKNRALAAMKIMGTKKLEGKTSTLQANAVAPSVEVYDELRLPEEFRNITVSFTVPLSQWRDRSENTIPNRITTNTSIDRLALLAALKQPCPIEDGCGGRGTVDAEAADGGAVCPKCSGRKTRQIPGARLIDNKYRLVVK